MSEFKRLRPVRFSVPEPVRKAIRRCAIDLEGHIERKRQPGHGPLVGYWVRAILELPKEEQLRLAKRGREIERDEIEKESHATKQVRSVEKDLNPRDEQDDDGKGISDKKKGRGRGPKG